jgi:hypothetical protein
MRASQTAPQPVYAIVPVPSGTTYYSTAPSEKQGELVATAAIAMHYSKSISPPGTALGHQSFPDSLALGEKAPCPEGSPQLSRS